MRARLFASLILLSIASASEHAMSQEASKEKATPATFDACTLIRKKEVEAVQGSPINETKSSERSDGDFRVSQCFYTADEFSRSITLEVFQKHPTDASKRSPIEFWNHTFARYRESKEGEKKEAERRGSREGEEGEGVPPRKLKGLGDEAFWVSNRFGGTLYVLKEKAFISISVGGTDSEEVKIDKSRKFATKALRRL
jgi:hypothetical protein